MVEERRAQGHEPRTVVKGGLLAKGLGAAGQLALQAWKPLHWPLPISLEFWWQDSTPLQEPLPISPEFSKQAVSLLQEPS